LLSPATEPLEDRTLLAGSLPAGSLDATFNQTGLVTAQVGTADSGGAGALQPDGKIVVAGAVTGSGGSQTIALVRYLPDGQLDTSFGAAKAGIVALDPGLQIDAASAVAVVNDPGQADDGRIVVVGTWFDPQAANTRELALVRFLADGSLDSTFGAAGVALDTTSPDAQGVALAIQHDGSIVVGGISNGGTITQPIDSAFVERFTGSGAPDSTFAVEGLSAPLFGGTSSALGGLALDSSADVIVAGIENQANGSLIAVARLKSDGTLDSSFGLGGVARIDPGGGDTALESVSGVAIDPSRGILVAGTGSPSAGATEDFLVARFDFSGAPEPTPAFNHGNVDLISSQQSGQSDDMYARAIAVQTDGKIVLGGYTPVPAAGQLGSVAPLEFTLARLNPDGTPDPAFGQRGQVVTDLTTAGLTVEGLPQSILVQPDGNLVVTGEAIHSGTGQAVSAFAVARHIGITVPGSGTQPAGIYQEKFGNAADPTQPGFDTSGVFQHTFWSNLQPETSPSAVEGSGWDLEAFAPSGNFALHLIGATDTITFPSLRADVHISLASVDVTAATDARVTFVGDNGAYTIDVSAAQGQTVSAGESRVLEGDPLDPTLELGPIRELILDSSDAYSGAFFSNIKILVIPGQGPLDDFVTVPPNIATPIDVLDFATGGAAAAGLQAPLRARVKLT
jgi:uncharacterized delta-60 repeat protein